MPPSPSTEPSASASPLTGDRSADDAFLRRLLAASPDCIKVLDLDAKLLSMNAGGQAALGIDELTPHLGTCWTDWWAGPARAAAEAAVAAAKAGDTGRFEAGGTTPGGAFKWWDVIVTAIPGPDGRPDRLMSVSRDITARREARDQAAERGDRLRSVVESAKDYAVIGVGLDGRNTDWSRGAADTFGWPEATAVGQAFDLIWTADDRATGGPGQELALARSAGVAPDNRWHVRADGRRIYVVGATRPVHDAAGVLSGYVKVCRDDTDERAAETALRAERELLRTVFDQAPDDAILVMDADRTLTAWNPAAERITGWSAAEAIGQSADIIFTPEDRAAGGAAGETTKAAAAGKTADERWHVRRDGSRFWGSGTMNALHHADGSIRGYLKVFRDATEKHAEREALSFRGRLADAVRPLSDPAGVQAAACGVLARQLSAGRAAYFEIDGGDYVVGQDHAAAGVRSLAGRHPVAAFGRDILDRLAAGRTVVVADAAATLCRSDAERAAFADWQVGALLTVPLVKGGAFVAGLTVHAPAPRQWTADEVSLAEQTAERTWAAVERARAEAAVRASEARLRALVAASAQVVYRVNADWSALVQLNGGSFLADTAEPDRAWLDAYIPPDDQPAVRAEIAAAIAGKRIYDLEHRVNRPDGSLGWAWSRAVPILDAAGEVAEWFGFATDITDRKRSAAALAFERHQLELIFRESPAAMALWSGEDLVFERVNPEYQDLFRGRAMVGRPLLEALPELRGQGFDELLRRVLHTGEPVAGRETLARIQRDFGGPVEDRYFDFSYLQVRDPDGRPWGVYDHAVDVTDRVRARQALEQSEAQTRAALAEAEQAGRMKDEFLATLSHELRTPLNAIVGWTQILRAPGADADDLAEGLAVIDRNARAQTQIIEDILDMSRIISGKLRLDVQRVDLAQLVRAGADTVRPAADAKGVRLQVVLDPLAGPITGDPGRLHQVFWNLLSNAVKFTPRGGRVQVVLERVNSHVEVGVTDTGEGIAAGFVPHVFDRFRQADGSTTRRHGGLGLGLAIVKQLVELHGGSVAVRSPGPGQGATFTVALPLTITHPAAADDAPTVAREHPSAEVPSDAQRLACDGLKGVAVLVVDDEPDARDVVRRLLEQCGAAVRTAGSAAEALLRLQARVPTVLVSDIGMPGEDGYALIRQVRALPPAQGGRVHALALTAYARAADRMRALEAGFQMHLSKPVEPAELVVTVAALAKLAADRLPGGGG